MKLGRYQLFILFGLGIMLYYYITNYNAYNLRCIIASKDGNRYCVRERNKLELAANLLATTTLNCKKLIAYLKEKYPEEERVQQLVKNFNPTKISETLPTSELTAYSENKGEKLAFCLNTTKHGDKLIDEHTLTFVALHELAHLMTTSIGHKTQFWENFKFILINAKKAGIHQPKDYGKQPQHYCGMTITDNPYYDLV